MIDRPEEEYGRYDLVQIIMATVIMILLAIIVDCFFPFWARTLYYVQAIVMGIVFAPLCWMGKSLWATIREKRKN